MPIKIFGAPALAGEADRAAEATALPGAAARAQRAAGTVDRSFGRAKQTRTPRQVGLAAATERGPHGRSSAETH
jgi:hypothetical protein